MRCNVSPDPIFESDDDRTWFCVRLPVHEQAHIALTGHATEHEAGQATGHVERLNAILTKAMSRPKLQKKLGLKSRAHFVKEYLNPALRAGLIEMTLPDTPKSTSQRYRLTQADKALARKIKRRNVLE